METVSKNLYEGMFLVDSALAASDWDGVLDLIKNILTRSEAEIVSLSKWDERKLAYEIEKKSRGTYLLCYFKVAGEKVKDIERDVKLSEKIMRVLILSTEPMSQEDLDRETPVMAAERREAEAAAAKAASEAEAVIAAEAAEAAEAKEADEATDDVASEVEDEAKDEEADEAAVVDEALDDVVSEVEEEAKNED